MKEYLHRLQWNFKIIVRERKIGYCLKGLAVVLVAVFFVFAGIKNQQTSAAEIQKGIAQQILRLHIIGNSDSEEDQAVKLQVKQAVVEALRPVLSDCKDKAEARRILAANMDLIVDTAEETLEENGYYYGATAEIGMREFPVKVYGDITLPAGEYEALCVELGEAKGQNWWCIVFPSLCFVDPVYGVVPEDSKEQLDYLLTDEEYDEITEGEGIKVRVKFKLWDYLKNLL